MAKRIKTKTGRRAFKSRKSAALLVSQLPTFGYGGKATIKRTGKGRKARYVVRWST